MNSKMLNRENAVKATLLLLLIIVHWNIRKFGDDLWMQARVLTDKNIFIVAYSFVYNYYITWLPSVFPTYLFFSLSHCGIWVWKGINIAFCLVIIIMIKNVFLYKYDRNQSLLCSTMFFFLYSFTDQDTAGWLATTTRYLWVAACMLIAILPIKKILLGEQISKEDYFFALISTVYATNTEQGAAVLLPIFCVMAMYIWKNGGKCYFLFGQIFAGAINLYYLLSSPGIPKRFASEIVSWYPDYINFSLVERLYLGLSSTIVNRFFMGRNWLYVVMILLLAFILLSKKHVSTLKASCIATTYFIPLFRALDLFPAFLNSIFPIVTDAPVLTGNFPLVGYSNWNTVLPYFHIVVCFLLPIALVFGIYAAFDDKNEKILFVLIFLAGLLSRVMMGLSPTVYASSTRTFTFFDLSIIIIDVCLFMKCITESTQKTQKILWCTLGMGSICHYIDTVMLIKEFFLKLK